MPLKANIVKKKDLKHVVGVPVRRNNVPNISPGLIELINREHDYKKGHYFSLGERMLELYYTSLSYKGEDNEQWHFKRLLGYGGFGIAALYEKHSDDGQMIDRLALKSEIASRINAVESDKNEMMVLSREVWNHAQIMDRDCDSNLFLFGFKYHFCDNSIADGHKWPERAGWTSAKKPFFQEWRTYLEFGALETIHHLILKYKAWGYHLPEAFIWWMFYWLLESCHTLGAQKDHIFVDLTDRPLPPTTYMLHNDMSYHNFYMQAADEDAMHHGKPLDDYPVPKMADFGLCQLTQLTNLDNRARNIYDGLPAFKSPERRQKQDRHSSFYAFGPSARAPPWPLPMLLEKTEYWNHDSRMEHPVGAQSNLWGIAYIVYLLMTLENALILDDIIQGELDNHEIYRTIRPRGDRRRSSGGYYLFEQVRTDLPQWTDHDCANDYSEELKDLVLRCIKLRPQDRPDPQAVRAAVQDGMLAEMSRLDAEFDNDQELIAHKIRVCTSDVEWNSLPRGPCDHNLSLQSGLRLPIDDPSRIFWNDFHEFCTLQGTKDPDAPRLVPPAPASAPDAQLTSGAVYLDPKDYVTYVSSKDMKHYHNCDPLSSGGRAQNPDKVQARQILDQLKSERERLAFLQHQTRLAEDHYRRSGYIEYQHHWADVSRQGQAAITECEAAISNLTVALQAFAKYANLDSTVQH